jgi:hypothetical protein
MSKSKIDQIGLWIILRHKPGDGRQNVLNLRANFGFLDIIVNSQEIIEFGREVGPFIKVFPRVLPFFVFRDNRFVHNFGELTSAYILMEIIPAYICN